MAYSYPLLPGQPQVNRFLFGRQLFVSHCFPVHALFAQHNDDSGVGNMKWTRTRWELVENALRNTYIYDISEKRMFALIINVTSILKIKRSFRIIQSRNI